MSRFNLSALVIVLAGLSATVQANDFNDGVYAAESGDYTAAMAKWMPLAEGGDADAQFNVALAVHKGLGVPADERTAVGWYHLAANNGNVRAQEFLVAAYSEGWFGLERNAELAQYWEQRLAQH